MVVLCSFEHRCSMFVHPSVYVGVGLSIVHMCESVGVCEHGCVQMCRWVCMDGHACICVLVGVDAYRCAECPCMHVPVPVCISV